MFLTLKPSVFANLVEFASPYASSSFFFLIERQSVLSTPESLPLTPDKLYYSAFPTAGILPSFIICILPFIKDLLSSLWIGLCPIAHIRRFPPPDE